MTDPVRWGFLGAGFVASRALAPAVHVVDDAVLAVVASRDLSRATALGGTRSTTSYAEVCEADDVDAVYVSLPNDAHRTWVLAALAAGKHVLCEKPLGTTTAEVAQMQAAALDADRLLVEASWNRWHPRTRRAEELVAAAGGPQEVRARFTFAGVPDDNYRLDPDRGGGALLDVGGYVVASALAFLGDDDIGVVGAQRHLGPTGVDLTTEAVLTSAQGRAEVLASFERPESQRVRVEAPGLVVELPHPAFTSWRTESVLRVVHQGVERLETFQTCDAYALMVSAVSDRIGGGDAWVLPPAVSHRVAVTLDAIVAAARADHPEADHAEADHAEKEPT